LGSEAQSKREFAEVRRLREERTQKTTAAFQGEKPALPIDGK
jgi:hypothetical protein